MQTLARKVKLYPNKTQAANLDRTLETCRRLYNHCLELRQDAYEIEGKTLTAPACNRWFTCLRHDPKNWPYYSMLSVSVGQRVIRDVDTAYRAFFKRVKKGETPGFPRFKGQRFFSRFTYTYNQGASLVGNKLYLKDSLDNPNKCYKDKDRALGCIKFRPRNTFPEGEITINDGGAKTLTVEIWGTSTSRTIEFKAAGPSGAYRQLAGVRLADLVVASSTTDTGELWQFDVTGLASVVIAITAIEGGNVSIAGRVVA